MLFPAPITNFEVPWYVIVAASVAVPCSASSLYASGAAAAGKVTPQDEKGPARRRTMFSEPTLPDIGRREVLDSVMAGVDPEATSRRMSLTTHLASPRKSLVDMLKPQVQLKKLAEIASSLKAKSAVGEGTDAAADVAVAALTPAVKGFDPSSNLLQLPKLNRRGGSPAGGSSDTEADAAASGAAAKLGPLRGDRRMPRGLRDLRAGPLPDINISAAAAAAATAGSAAAADASAGVGTSATASLAAGPTATGRASPVRSRSPLEPLRGGPIRGVPPAAIGATTDAAAVDSAASAAGTASRRPGTLKPLGELAGLAGMPALPTL